MGQGPQAGKRAAGRPGWEMSGAAVTWILTAFQRSAITCNKTKPLGSSRIKCAFGRCRIPVSGRRLYGHRVQREQGVGPGRRSRGRSAAENQCGLRPGRACRPTARSACQMAQPECARDKEGFRTDIRFAPENAAPKMYQSHAALWPCSRTMQADEKENRSSG